MRQVEAFEAQLKQLSETLKEYQEAVHPGDKRARAAELKSYLRSMSMLAERIHDETLRHDPKMMLRRVMIRHESETETRGDS